MKYGTSRTKRRLSAYPKWTAEEAVSNVVGYIRTFERLNGLKPVDTVFGTGKE